MVQERTRKKQTSPKPTVVDDYGQAQLTWFESNPPELEPYRGKWVALIGQTVVASGATMMEALNEVRRRGLTGPFLARVPSLDEPEYFIG